MTITKGYPTERNTTTERNTFGKVWHQAYASGHPTFVVVFDSKSKNYTFYYFIKLIQAIYITRFTNSQIFYFAFISIK